jgi:DNA-binding transcriptional LysR family regulator
VGQSVYRHARTIADEAQATLSTVAETLNEPSGLVRIRASTLTAELYLAGWLGEFTATYPKVRIALELSNRFVCRGMPVVRRSNAANCSCCSSGIHPLAPASTAAAREA